MWKNFLTAIPVARDSLLLSLHRLHAEISTRQAAATVVEEAVEEIEGLGCSHAWSQAKEALRGISEHPEISLQPLAPDILQRTIAQAKDKFPTHYFETSECGLARVSVEVGNLVAADVPVEILLTTEAIASPVMTLVLEFDWGDISESKWPIFQLLAQWQLRSMRNIDMADLGDELNEEFFALLINGLNQGDLAVVYDASYAYLNLSEGRVSLATLCALAGLAVKDKVVLTDLQLNLKAVVTTVEDLLATFLSPWPLWPLLSIAAR